MLAAKAALAVRIDAFSEGNENNHMGMEQRIYLERRLRELDNRSVRVLLFGVDEGVSLCAQ